MDDYSELVDEYVYMCSLMNCDCPYNDCSECEPLFFEYDELEHRLQRMKEYYGNRVSRLTRIEKMMEGEFDAIL